MISKRERHELRMLLFEAKGISWIIGRHERHLARQKARTDRLIERLWAIRRRAYDLKAKAEADE